MPQPNFARPALFALLALCCFLSYARPAGAVARSWNNAAGGSAATGTNWTPNGVPGSADNLIFPLASVYAVSFPSGSVPLVISHDYRLGSIATISTDGTHTCSNSFGVGQTSTAGVNITGGTFQAATVVVGSATGIFGRLSMLNAGGFPIPASPFFAQTDSNSSATFGNDGLARLELFGGSVYRIDGTATFGNTAASRCTLTIAGLNVTTAIHSSLITTNPNRNFTFAGSGQFVGNVDNGGVIHVAGRTWLGQRPGSIGILRLGATTTTFDPSITFDGLLRIGDSGFGGSQGGDGEVEVYKGNFSVGGLCTLGDPDGTTGSAAALHVYGGQFLIGNGMTRYSATTYQQLGGTVHFAGGPVSWGNLSMDVTSTIASPVLWFSNGTTSSNIGPMRVGRKGTGLLRVTQPGTNVQSVAELVVGDSLGGSGTVEMDSSAVFGCFSPMMLGRAGAATVTVRGGASLGTNQIFLGYLPGSSSLVTITGAGSVLNCNSLYIGSDGTNDGGTATLVADSSAVVDCNLTTSVVREMNPGILDVRHGGLFRANYLEIRHLVELDAGTLETNSVDFIPSSTLHGRGTVIGTSNAYGVVDVRRDPGTFGRLTMQGDYNNHLATLKLALGRPGGVPHCDTLKVTGQAGLSGTLEIEADPTFLMNTGDSYRVMIWTTRNSTFPSITWRGGAAADSFDIVYLSNGLLLTAKTGNVDVPGTRQRVTDLRLRSLGASAGTLAFSLELPEDAQARVTLHDVSGRDVALLQDGPLAAGTHRLTASAGALPAGVYFAHAVVEHEGQREFRSVKVVRVP